MVEPIFEIKNLSFSYPKSSELVLKNMNFQIFQNEFVALLGPSGSGKSTLLFLLGGLIQPAQGQIFFQGMCLQKLNDFQLSLFRNHYIGFVFQQFHLLSQLTVAENIQLPSAFPLEMPQSMNENSTQDLKTFGLFEKSGALPHELSGGQRQRVAIIRALSQQPQIILADEPTGNLDSANSQKVMQELLRLKTLKKTIVLITHDEKLAQNADRILTVRDGEIFEEKILKEIPRKIGQGWVDFKSMEFPDAPQKALSFIDPFIFRQSMTNLKKSKLRSLLTLFGISVGIAAVFSMLCLGGFVKKQVLQGYNSMGVNTLMIRGYKDWNQKFIDPKVLPFDEFVPDRDFKDLKEIFPAVQKISPTFHMWGLTATFGGRKVDKEATGVGVSDQIFSILPLQIEQGDFFSEINVANKDPVCVIGSDLQKNLFENQIAIGQVVTISSQQTQFYCVVKGVLKARSSKASGRSPNSEIYIPYTFLKQTSKEWWSTRIDTMVIQLSMDSEIEKTGIAIKNFLQMKYGSNGSFWVDSDAILLEQMAKFLNIFQIFLVALALICLSVGSIGVTNMMLVSLSERTQEIGLYRALGCTSKSLKILFLQESLITCSVAGLVGIVFGFIVVHLIIWGASFILPNFLFVWIWDIPALIFSLLSMFLVGYLSGLIPAGRAEKLSPLEALEHS